MNKVTISLDFELGWGVLDSELWRRREKSGIYENLRGKLDLVFDSLADREVPTTWATVAGMLVAPLDESRLDHLPVEYKKAVVTFQKSAKKSTIDARDIVDKHWFRVEAFSEIASHTTTHIYPEFPGVTSTCYREDVSLSLKILEQYFGKTVKSMVFTRDDTTFLSSVAGICNLNLRTECPAYGQRNDGSITRIAKGCRRYLENVPRSTVAPSMRGSTTQSGSLYFNWSGGRYSVLKKVQLEVQVRRLLRVLSSQVSGDYHIWLHPFNLAETADHTSRFLWFIDRLVALRDAGQIEIVTMSGFSHGIAR